MLEQIEIDDPTWVTFVMSHPQATLFHHPAWTLLLKECYGYRPFAVVLLDEIGKVVAGLPMMQVTTPFGGQRWVSLPFTDHCAPLVQNGIVLHALTNELITQQTNGRLRAIEVRAPLAPDMGVQANASFVLHSLALGPDPNEVFGGFDRKFRQYPRKAEREGLSVHSTGTQSDVDAFYHLHLKTRVKLGVPIQPRRFFDLLWERIIAKGLGKIILAVNEKGQTISGAVILCHGTQAMIKYSASHPEYLASRCHYFTFWKCIEWACLNGMSVIDFGRTDIAEDGLRKFKDGWGGKESRLAYSLVTDKPIKQSANRIKKTLSTVIRHSPPWVCRTIGEMFYKYAA